MRKNRTTLLRKDTDKVCRGWSVQMLDRGAITVDTVSGSWGACHAAALIIYDWWPKVEDTYEECCGKNIRFSPTLEK